MDKLSAQQCEACRADAPLVTQSQIDELMHHVPQWKIIEIGSVKHLRREFAFNNFVEALAFTNKVAEIAEQVGHHPAILTEWGKVTVEWWSHKIKGLHMNDFIMAARTDELLLSNA